MVCVFGKINRVAKPLNILNIILNHANNHFLFHNGNKCRRNMILLFSKKSILEGQTEGGWDFREKLLSTSNNLHHLMLNVSRNRMIWNRKIIAQTKHGTLLFFCAKFIMCFKVFGGSGKQQANKQRSKQMLQNFHVKYGNTIQKKHFVCNIDQSSGWVPKS